jgi:protein TonB
MMSALWGRGWLRFLMALLAGAVGVAMTLQAVVILNIFVDPRDKETGKQIVSFSLPTVKQAAPPPTPPPPKSRPRSSEKSLAPLPDLGGAGSSAISLDVPDYSQADLGTAGNGLLGNTDNVAMTAETVDKPPVVKRGSLVYPEAAKQKGLTGRVTVSILIGTDGRVQKSKILDSNPAGVFDAAVLTALPGWVFAPAEYKGRPVPIWVTLPLDFSPK